MAGADAEQGSESGMPSAATVEAEDKLIEVGLTVLAAPASTSTPFALGLVVPETRRARLAQRDDPLDPQTRPGQQCRDLFGCPRVRERREVHGTAARTPATARRQPA